MTKGQLGDAGQVQVMRAIEIADGLVQEMELGYSDPRLPIAIRCAGNPLRSPERIVHGELHAIPKTPGQTGLQTVVLGVANRCDEERRRGAPEFLEQLPPRAAAANRRPVLFQNTELIHLACPDVGHFADRPHLSSC